MTAEKACPVDGCGKRVIARGWCSKHYERWRRHGSPEGGRDRYDDPEASFLARTATAGDCLIWTGGRNVDGYGNMNAHGRKLLSHRYAWERVNGAIPSGSELDHVCRNPACVKVDHLRLATRKQNNENTGLSRLNTSGFKGVYYSKKDRMWIARVTHLGVRHVVGYFRTASEAGAAAKARRIELFTYNTLDRLENAG